MDTHEDFEDFLTEVQRILTDYSVKRPKQFGEERILFRCFTTAEDWQTALQESERFEYEGYRCR